MAFRAFTVSVDETSPTQLFAAQGGDVEAEVRLVSGSIRLGGSDIDASSKYLLLQGGGSSVPFRSRIRPGDELWALAVGTGNVTAFVMIRSA